MFGVNTIMSEAIIASFESKKKKKQKRVVVKYLFHVHLLLTVKLISLAILFYFHLLYSTLRLIYESLSACKVHLK